MSSAADNMGQRGKGAKGQSRTRIKICGLRTVDDALAAVDAGADAVGLVFVEASPRHVDLETAAAIVAALTPFVERVGLFVDAAPDVVRRTAETFGLTTIQLHGNETRDTFRALYGYRLIKAIAFGVSDPDDLSSLMHEPELSAVLIDAPPRDGLTGGTGESLDWTALARFQPRDTKPLILAGGLTPDNVGEAIRIVRPFAVDVSSGVESSRGVKDPGMIADFCAAVRTADARIAAE